MTMSSSEQSAAPALLLFVNASQVATCAGPGTARAGAAMSDAAVQSGVAVLARGARIEAVGDERTLRAQQGDAQVIDCHGGVLTPGFVDSHTHAIFGRA